jgi:hypothetical protein
MNKKLIYMAFWLITFKEICSYNVLLLFSSPNRQTDISFLSIVIPHPRFSDSRTTCVYIHNSRGNPITTKEDTRARLHTSEMSSLSD